MRKILMMSLVALALAGCNTEPVKKTEPQQQTQSSENSNNNTAPMNNASSAQNLSAEQAAKQALSSVGFTIYFDYDKSDIKPEYNSVIAAHAKYLSSNASVK